MAFKRGVMELRIKGHAHIVEHGLAFEQADVLEGAANAL